MADQKNKTAIVTGAGSGVGRAAAVLLAGDGYNVVLVARTKETLEETAEMVATEGAGDVESLVLPADLTDPDVPQMIVDKTLEKFGRIDAIANVAGAAPLRPIHQNTAETWRTCIDTNLSYVVLLTAAVWPHFRKRKSGVIVNVSSMASIDPFPGFSMYASAKVGLNMFTKVTADEGAKPGIKAVAVAPGAIETPMLRENFAEKTLPTDKTLDPFEVAGVIRDCITGEREFKSGEVIEMPSP